MSRGLGKIQSQLLELIPQKQHKDGWTFLSSLIPDIYHPDRPEDRFGIRDYSYTRAEHVAVHRAIDSLERRGLVETKRETSGWRFRVGEKTGGTTILRKVRLKC